MDRRIHFLSREPTGEVYRGLIDVSMEFCSMFLLVVRDTIADASVQRILESLETFLQRKARESKWPGTELFDGGTATIYYYQLCEESARILKESVEGVYSWQQPYCPEDLCLLRPDGSAWFVSMADECESYFELTPGEKDGLLAALPQLGPLVVESRL